MKLKKLVIAVACSSLLALNVAAAPTQVQQLEFEDKTTIAKIIKDENDLTQVEVKLDGDTYSFSFTQDELDNPQTVKEKLSDLSDASANKVANLLQRINSRSNLDFDVYIEKSLSPEDQLKVEQITRKMEAKGRELEAKAKDIEVHVVKLKSHALKMAASHGAMDEREKELESYLSEIEIHADEIEHQAMELEHYFDEHGEELEVIIDRLADDASELASQYANVQVEFIERDDNGANQHVFIIRADAKSDITAELIESIKHSDLSEEQKQTIRDALN